MNFDIVKYCVHDRLNDCSAGVESTSGCINENTSLGLKCCNAEHYHTDECPCVRRDGESLRGPCNCKEGS
jgi:hypothetical protein